MKTRINNLEEICCEIRESTKEETEYIEKKYKELYGWEFKEKFDIIEENLYINCRCYIPFQNYKLCNKKGKK